MNRYLIFYIIPGLFWIYGISLVSSMASMELFGWLLGLCGTYIFFTQPHEKEQIWIGPDLSLFFLLCIAVIGFIINSPDKSDPLMVLGELRWIVFFYFLVYTFHRIELKNLEKWFFYFCLTSQIVALYAISQFFFGKDIVHGNGLYPIGHYWRSQGFFGMPLSYAYSIGLVSCLALAKTVTTNNLAIKQKMFYCFTALITAISVLTSFTRGAWLALFFAYVFIYFLSKPSKKSWLYLSLLIGSTVLLFTQNISFHDRFLSIFNMQDPSNSGRIDIWIGNLAIFKEFKWFGIGYGQNQTFLPNYCAQNGVFCTKSHAHNTFLQFLSGTGILGLITYIIFVLTLFIITWRLWKKISLFENENFIKTWILGSLGGQVYLHIGGLSECNFKDYKVNHMFLMMMAWVMIFAYRNKIQRRLRLF